MYKLKPAVTVSRLGTDPLPAALIFNCGSKTEFYEGVTTEDLKSLAALQIGSETMPKGQLAIQAHNVWGMVDCIGQKTLNRHIHHPKSREISYRSCLTDLESAQATIDTIENAVVLLVGLGGLGSHTAEHLARIGVQDFHLVDPDFIEESNLNRQIAYTHHDVGKSKSLVCADRLRSIGASNVKVHSCLSSALVNFGGEITDAFVTADNDPLAIRLEVISALYPKGVRYGFAGYSGTRLSLSPLVYNPDQGCGICLEILMNPGSSVSQMPFEQAIAPSSYAINAIGASIMVENWVRELNGDSKPLSLKFETQDFSLTRKEIKRLSLCPVCGKGG